MKIAACIIVKDDTEYVKLSRCLKSIHPFVDGVYLTTTGKGTTKIKALPEIHHSHFEWNDSFADARNFNFSRAPKDADYIFWLDSDDILYGGELLREIAQLAKDNGKDSVLFTYWYGCTFDGEPSYSTVTNVELAQMRERLMRPSVFTWKARLHETPVPVPGVQNNHTQYPYDPKERPFVVVHTATLADASDKMERNQRILELQLKEERESGEADPRTLLYLMKIYAELDDKDKWDECLIMGEEYLKKSGWDEERATCYEMMSQVWFHKDNPKEAIQCLHQALLEYPHNVILYVRLATAYYNIKNYKACRHWLDVASKMDLDKHFTAGTTNYHAIKTMFAELLVKLNYNVDKDTQKALEAARMLEKELPTKANKEQVLFLQDLSDLNDACKKVDDLVHYLDDINAHKSIVDLLEALPDAITKQPFAMKIRQRFTPARKWKDNEICYFANFGGKNIEQWDSSSLSKGIGGSETAVIKLAEEWTKLGYKVTVYGDPLIKGEQNGVVYLPWYYFNIRDSFNIFIQWRGWQIADKVKAKKFYVDLHDIYSPVDISKRDLECVDKFMVKSDYHRKLAPMISSDKFLAITNGL